MTDMIGLVVVCLIAWLISMIAVGVAVEACLRRKACRAADVAKSRLLEAWNEVDKLRSKNNDATVRLTKARNLAERLANVLGTDGGCSVEWQVRGLGK